MYQAWDPVLDREVALKVPHPGLLADEENKQRYLREPKAAGRLRHPNIVPVFEAGFEGESLYSTSPPPSLRARRWKRRSETHRQLTSAMWPR